MNVLFVLYESLESNGALHVHHFANQLADLGAHCALAIPAGPLDLPLPGGRKYSTLPFADPGGVARAFPDGRGPDLIHAWTPRERVRVFCEAILGRHPVPLLVHLEDNEDCLLERLLNKPLAQLAHHEVPETLSHPRRYREFLARAQGATIIVEPLAEFLPDGLPRTLLWPGADTDSFHPLPPGGDRFGIPPDVFVVAYTGNVHPANAREVRSVYLAAALLSREGLPTVVLRTGKDFCSFLGEDDSWARPHAMELGFVPHADLPQVLARADLLVQPGRPDRFNDYRLPSKLPEYLAMGKPVLLPLANLGHHLVHREQALVCPVVDALAIVDAVRLLLEEPGLAERLGQGALAFAHSHLVWRDSAARLLAFYRSVCGFDAAPNEPGLETLPGAEEP
jgi:glycosyltransferase involved in cell wall biosynthesis